MAFYTKWLTVKKAGRASYAEKGLDKYIKIKPLLTSKGFKETNRSG